jgi:dTDP-4-amino-4,6-dideoxygalactose transaminase
MDPAKIEEKITRPTKAILFQHTYGIPAQMDSIMEIARAHKL